MRRIVFWVALSPTIIALLVASCTKHLVDVRTHAPEEPIRVEAKVEPIKVDINAKVELHIYQHALTDLAHITGTAPPATTEPKAPTQPEPPKESVPPAENKESGAGNVLLRFLGVGVAHAEAASDQEQLRRVLDSMKRRYATLGGYKADGSVGENHNGYVQERASPKMSDGNYARAVRKTIAEENADRTLLYQVRARIDGTTPASQAAAYAKAWRERYARPGEWIEVLVDRNWVWKQK